MAPLLIVVADMSLDEKVVNKFVDWIRDMGYAIDGGLDGEYWMGAFRFIVDEVSILASRMCQPLFPR